MELLLQAVKNPKHNARKKLITVRYLMVNLILSILNLRSGIKLEVYPGQFSHEFKHLV
ncbi:hypothetical protein H1P_3120003 [Hyella patelloides LEGE 07179]|uniref:Transposase n=1 Tax=Hyella patelloides LEGE 07179 TaxID=945734 RepID=A0A563VUU4_9CYAN|nr:hypothetical protein H1P_3120003 [Hyella patelloides LEGE 07179]